ncbi:glycoside hydrolase family 172 protein [Melioribacteraceae bacterium 4301-Me]|uniref:glycoside hydrolase family 172 protein n=1 Tax=Pyranulibacter aquaticus TaxID=3163344 RepID=UPI00359A39D8
MIFNKKPGWNFFALITVMLLLNLPYKAQSQIEKLLSPSSLPFLKDSKLVEISSFDTTGGNNDRISIKEGETATIANIKGPGLITRIWVTIDSRDPYFLRRLLIKMYWDGEKNPSVEVPIGDFFGTGFKYKQYVSEFTGMTSGGYYCYFPMPFQKSAKIEVVNQTGMEVYAFYYQIEYQKLKYPLPQNVAYFHAWWNRELKTKSKDNYLILSAKGKGQFVGLNMSMQSYNGQLWYLEGDEMVYVDGEKKPSLNGTGTEDFFTSGWYFNHGEFSAPYHGLIIKDDSAARIAAYRFMVGDQIPFTKSIKFTIEHGTENSEIADYSSTAYWYQKEPHEKFSPMLKPSLRIPLRIAVPNDVIEAETLSVVGNDIETIVEKMDNYGPDWSNFKQLKINLKEKLNGCSITIPTPLDDKYNIDIYYTKAPDYCNVDVLYRREKVGEIFGYDSEVYPAGKITIKGIRSVNNKIILELVNTGRDTNSKGSFVGLDAFKLEPNRTYIPEWYIIGPYPNKQDSKGNRLGLDEIFLPEKEFDTTKTYFGQNNQQISWRLIKTLPNGYFSLYGLVNPNELVVTYALTYVYSPYEQTLPLLFSSDDGSKVFLNDEMIFRFLKINIAQPDQFKIPLHLKKGWNKLLLKIENNLGGYGFYARILDLDNTLVFSPFKKE